jgi:hypothetical protein
VGRKRNEPEISEQLDARLARLESAMWGLVWLLAVVCAAMIVAYACVYIRGHFLDDEMDVVSASIGGG